MLILYNFKIFIILVDAQQSTVGTDFVFGFINNWEGAGKLYTIVSNANDQPTNLTITSIYPSFVTINMIVQPNSVEKVNKDEVEIQISL